MELSDSERSMSMSSESSTETLPGGPPDPSPDVSVLLLPPPTAERGPQAELSEFLILHSPRPDQRDSTASLPETAETPGYSGDGEFAGHHSGYEASGEGSSTSEHHSLGQDEAGPSAPSRSGWASRFNTHSSTPEDSLTWRRHRQGVGHSSFIPVNADTHDSVRYRRYRRTREWSTPSTTDAEGAGEPGHPRSELPRHLIRPDTTAEEVNMDVSLDDSSQDEDEWYQDHGDNVDDRIDSEGEDMEDIGQDIDLNGDEDDIEQILLLGPRSSSSSEEL